MTHQRYFSRILLYLGHLSHPRRPRDSQSGREKKPDESFQARAEEPLATDPHLAISKRLGECWLLIWHKKCFDVKYIWNNSFLNCIHFWDMNSIKLTSLPMCGFIAQLVEQRTGNAEVTGSNPVEALTFFRLLLSNCFNWKIYRDDHSSLSKNALYFCAQSANSISWVLFVRSYTTAIVSPYLSLEITGNH